MATPEASSAAPAGLGEPFGEILVRKGRLARHELDQALVEARSRGVRLGEYLISIGSVYEEDIAQALAEQYRLRYFTLDARGIDRSNRMIIPEALAKRLVALPLRHTDSSVVIAVADPTDVFGTDELQMVVQRPIELVVAERSAIEAGIRSLYSTGSSWADDEPIVGAGRAPAVELAPEPVATQEGDVVEGLLRKAIELRASEIHCLPRQNDLLVRVRVGGVLSDLEVVPLELRSATVVRLKSIAQLDGGERRLPLHGRVATNVDGTTIDLRTSSLPSMHGEEVTFRIRYVGRELVGLDQLGIDDATWGVFGLALHRRSGLIVLTGPACSGKTTTLYAALAELNDGSRTIAGIEDPVEVDVDGIVQVQVDPRVELDTAGGLAAVLRGNPDVVFAGELVDAETLKIALQAAVAGRLVLATMESDGAAAALVRLRQLGADPAAIGSAVSCVVAQRLLRASGHAAQQGQARIAVFEALGVSNAVQRVLAGSTAEIQAAAVGCGMRPLGDKARELAARGLASAEEVSRVCGELEG
jgi:type IV pilus assembly protein PilB